jgi:hypothetical protein
MNKSVTLEEFKGKLVLLLAKNEYLKNHLVTLYDNHGEEINVLFEGVISASQSIIREDEKKGAESHIFMSVGGWRPFPYEYVSGP